MKTTVKERLQWWSDAMAVYDTPWSFISADDHEVILDYEGGTLIGHSFDDEDDIELNVGTDEMVHIANANPSNMIALLQDIETLRAQVRALKRRMREGADGGEGEGNP